MKQMIDALHTEWRDADGPQQRDRMVAEALGGEVFGEAEPRVRWRQAGRPQEEPLPPYSTNLNAANQAMDQAWDELEETAPWEIHCHRDPDHPSQRGDCYVEWWWPDDETHVVTPRFASEAEGRAFAAFAFARLQRQV